jgi:CelD/BcsL family acetyltransferase involved in cellulose biosynthesis
MKLNVAKTVTPEEWDASVAALGGTIHHTTTWAAYLLAAQPNAEALYLTLADDSGEPVAIALAIEERSNRRLLSSLTGRLSLSAFPAIRPGAEDGLLEFLRHLEHHARDTGLTELVVESSASRGGEEELSSLGFELVHRMEFELSLEPDEDGLWRNMKQKRRKNIKKARRSEVILRDLDSQEGVQELRRLQALSSERIVARGGRDISFKGEQRADPATVLADSDLGRIVVAEAGGEIVSAGLFTCFNGGVYHTLSGHSRAALDTQAPTLLIWQTILRYREEGANRFNFGGCKADAINEGDPEHGIYDYKRAFGTECIPCTSGCKVLRKAAHAAVKGVKKLLGR